jgi:hypothetical protein
MNSPKRSEVCELTALTLEAVPQGDGLRHPDRVRSEGFAEDRTGGSPFPLRAEVGTEPWALYELEARCLQQSTFPHPWK